MAVLPSPAFTHTLAWAAPPRAGRWAMAEVVGLTLLLASVSAALVPSDPLLVSEPFPWLWLCPVLLALRYGTRAAFTSSLLLVLMWALFALVERSHSAFPTGYFLGGLLLTLLAGEFADIWSTRLRHASAANAYLGERLEALTRNHYLMRMSHERLEQQLLTKPVTLQDALQRLRMLVAQAPQDEPLPQAGALLHLMTQACQLEVAALYALDAHGGLRPEPVARIGEAGVLDRDDPLLRHALAQRTLCHVQGDAAADGSRYLVVAPLTDSAGRIVALLAVERLPFLSLNRESLCFLAVLGGYYADSVQLAPAQALAATLPACPLAFAGELLRLQRIQHEAGLVSSLIAVAVEPGARQEEQLALLRRQARELDVVWEFSEAGRVVVLTLLALQGAAAQAGYARRLEQALGTAADGSAGVTLHAVTLAGPPEELLHKLLTRCRHVRS
jgi:hypothetical protein